MSAPRVFFTEVATAWDPSWLQGLSAEDMARCRLQRRETDLGAFLTCRHMLRNIPQPGPYLCKTQSKGCVAVALSETAPLGFDLEWVDPSFDWQSLGCSFSPFEREKLEAMPGLARGLAALKLWTLKEALVKLSGLGLFLAPECFDLDLEATCLVADRSHTFIPGQVYFSVNSLQCNGRSYVASLASRVPIGQALWQRFQL